MTGPWRDVTPQRAISRLNLWYIILSTVVCEIYLAETGHDLSVRRLLWSIRRWNPPCNAEDNLRAGLIVIEAWFRGY